VEFSTQLLGTVLSTPAEHITAVVRTEPGPMQVGKQQAVVRQHPLRGIPLVVGIQTKIKF
jgi:hypothetical protein